LSAFDRRESRLLTMTAPVGVTRFYGKPNFALDVLENQYIALVRVTLLNDPFDPYGFFETDFNSYVDLLKYVQKSHPHDRGWFRAHVTPQSWGSTERQLRNYMADLRRDTFVLCMSAPTSDAHPEGSFAQPNSRRPSHRDA
jgi:hypothetical protein